MTLQELLGADYKDGMTPEEIGAAIASKTFIDQATLNGQYVSKKLFDKTAGQLAEAKRQAGTQISQAHNENQDLLDRIAALEAENKQAKRDAGIAATKASLIAQGYDDKLAGETAQAMADNDFAKVLANQGTFLAAQTQKIKDDLLKGTPAPAAGGSGTGTAVDYGKAKADALNAGNDAEYMRLCRMEAESQQNTQQ